MKEIKFRYTFKNTVFGEIYSEIYTLEQIEKGELSWIYYKSQTIKVVSRDLCTGRKDIHDEDIYDDDNVRSKSGNEKLIVKWCDREAGFNLYKENGEFVWGNVGFNTEIIKEK